MSNNDIMSTITVEEKNEVSNLLKQSLMRLCGGGISMPLSRKDQETVIRNRKKCNDDCPNNSNGDNTFHWRKQLESLAIKSVSCTNGKRKSNTNVKGKAREYSDDTNFGKGHDIESRVALTLFYQITSQSNYKPKKQKRIGNDNVAEKKRKTKGDDKFFVEANGQVDRNENKHDKKHVSIEIISDLGLVRTVNSSQELSCLLVRDMEDQLQQDKNNQEGGEKSKIMMIQSNNSGIICIVTIRRFKYLRSYDRYPCSHCIKWCKGEKGLWWHEQVFHGLDHSIATTIAAATSSSSDTTAIVIHERNTCNSMYEVGNGNTQKESTDVQDGTDPFIDTIKRGDYKQFLKLVRLKKYDPISYLDKNGASALHWACGCGNLNIVKYLIEQCRCRPDQIQVGKRSFHGRTPLHWSCRNGHLNVVRYLVEQCEVDLDAKTIDGTTAFCWSSWQHHVHIMQYLHTKGADVNSVNSFGCNAVLWAAQSNQTTGLDAIKFLDKIGCDIEMVNSNGHTVLHKASQRGKKPVCDWVLSRMNTDAIMGSNHMTLIMLRMIAPDKQRCCPSDLAGQAGYKDLAKFLVDQERQICMEAMKVNVVPSWLQEGIMNAKHLSNRTCLDLYESGAAVRKIAAFIVTNTH